MWRQAERVGEPTETEEVGRLEWVPLARIPELARQQKILGSGALVPLLYYVASRGAAATGGRTGAASRRSWRSDLICAASRLACLA